MEAFAAWRRFFEALAEDGPTVLVFEDIHWADDALLDFIDLLADRAGAVPLLIVCTARPELFERREHWGGGKTNASTISLTPLSDEDTARLVGALLDQALLPAEVQQALLERVGGQSAVRAGVRADAARPRPARRRRRRVDADRRGRRTCPSRSRASSPPAWTR